MKIKRPSILAIVTKDVLVEIRSKEVVTPVIVFSSLVIVLCDFVFDPGVDSSHVASGVLWVALTFGGILGFGRLFGMERENGTFTGLVLAPVGREILLCGKIISGFLFITLVEIVMLPVFSLLFDLPIFLPWLWVIVLVTTAGFSIIGTIFSIITVHGRAREVMLPILFFPVAIPVIICAVQATQIVLSGGSWNQVDHLIGLIVAFDVVFLGLGISMAGFLLGE